MSNVKPVYISTTNGLPKPVDTGSDSVAVKAVYVQNSSTPDALVGVSRDGSNNLVLTDSVAGTKTLAQLAASVTFAREFYVAKNGSDATGDGSLSAPYLTIGAALTAAGYVGSGLYVRINVAPGEYVENITLERPKTFIVGAGVNPLDFSTTLKGTTVIACLGVNKFDDYLGFSGIFFTSTVAATAPTLRVTGTGLFTAIIDTCYIDAPNVGQYVVQVDASNASRPIVRFTDFYIARSAATATATLAQFERGDIRLDSGFVQSSATGTGYGIYAPNNATVVADRVQVDVSTTGGAVYMTGSIAGVKLILTNAAVTSRATSAASPALYLANTAAVGAVLWNNLLTMQDTAAGRYAIDGVYTSPFPPFYFGDISFGPNSVGVTNSSVNPTLDAVKQQYASLGVTSAINGGTGQSSYTVGDLLYANTATTLGKLVDVVPGNALISGGLGTAPSWGKVQLSGVAPHVNGTLPVANGGTGLATTPTNGQLLIGNGTGYTQAGLTAGTAITVTPGAGSISIANAGVTSNVAGTGISVSGPTGAVTISNAGVTAVAASTGISTSASTGSITLTNTGVTSIGTSGSGIGASASTGAVTLSNTGVTSLTAGTGILLSGSTGDVTITNTVTGPQYWTEGQDTTAPNDTRYVSYWTPVASTAIADVALVAKSTGATLAQIPNNQTSGGNKRGQDATDWQKNRNYASDIAFGYQSTVSGGASNSAYGSQSVVGGGASNRISAIGSCIPGGISNYIPASGYSSIATGYGANAREVYGRSAFSSWPANGIVGSRQTSIQITRGQTVGPANNQRYLTVDGTNVNSYNVNTLPNNTVYGIRCVVVARDTAGNAAAFESNACIARDVGAATIRIVGGLNPVMVLGADAGAAGWATAITVDTTYGAVVMFVIDTTFSANTIDWVCTMYTTELAPA